MGRGNERMEVVAAYVKGRGSFRELESKYGISASTIHRWVKDHEAGRKPIRKRKERDGQALTAKETEMSADVRRLRKELEEARLYNKLLNAMIDIAEEQFEIPIRKKSGAKRR